MAYFAYTSSAFKKHRTLWLNLSLALMLFSLMSKPMVVTLPLILLLLDIYPLRRLETSLAKRAIFLEKIPFIVVSALAGIITIIAQRSGEAMRSLEYFPLSGRLVIAIKTLIFYLEKAIMPFDLAPFYPLPKSIQLADWRYLLPIIIFFSITYLCVKRAKQGKPLFIIIWSCYVITLLPVIGIVQVGLQSAADRYTYLPLLSIFLLAGGGTARLFSTFNGHYQKVIFGTLLLSVTSIVACLGALTVQQIRIWHNSVSLWTHEISIFPQAVSFPYCSLGNAYLDNGQLHEAIAAYQHALAIEPRDAMAHTNIGVAYEQKGMLEEAIRKYRDAMDADPGYDLPHYNLGNVYKKKGMDEQSILEYRKALEINPDHAEAHNNLGQVCAKKGLFEEAITAYGRALAINPLYIDAYTNLGTAYLKKGMAPEAIARFRKAVDLSPGDAKAHGNLCAAYMRNKMFDAAVSECKQSISLNPTYTTAHYNLGSAYASKGMMDEAIVHFKQAVTLKPNYAMAHYNLGFVYYNKGDYDLSLFHYNRAKELGIQVDSEMLASLQSRQ
jgi:tetratricopeptide (TPR) repeat protein